MTDRSARLLAITCLVSLALNLLVLGALTTAFLRGFHPPGGPHGMPPGPMPMGAGPGFGAVTFPMPLIERLDATQRERARAIRLRHEAAIQGYLSERLVLQTALADVLAQPELDQAALDQAFSDLRALYANTAGEAQAMIAELALELDAEGRGVLADLLRKPAMRFKPRGFPEGEMRRDRFGGHGPERREACGDELAADAE